MSGLLLTVDYSFLFMSSIWTLIVELIDSNVFVYWIKICMSDNVQWLAWQIDRQSGIRLPMESAKNTLLQLLLDISLDMITILNALINWTSFKVYFQYLPLNILLCTSSVPSVVVTLKQAGFSMWNLALSPLSNVTKHCLLRRKWMWLQSALKCSSNFCKGNLTKIMHILKHLYKLRTYLLTILTWTNGDNYKDLIRW